MASPDSTISVQSLPGVWEECGRDRLAGIVPENITASANRWGSDRLSFQLRRSPGGQPFPDLTAFTPVEYRVAGQLVWSGRILETPTRDGAEDVISVEAQGWQYHLDDDLVTREYWVHNRLTDWKDRKNELTSTLGGGALVQAGQVSNDGALTLGFQKGYVAAVGDQAGVMLDLGPNTSAARIVLTGTTSNNVNSNPQVVVAVYVGDDPSGANATQILGDSALTTLTAAFTSWAASGTGRYVFIALRFTQAGTTSADCWVKFSQVLVVTDTAYESGGASILEAPTIVDDALDRGTMLLNADRTQIDPDAAATFAFPMFSPGEPKTPRELWNAADAPMQWIKMIDVERRAIYKPLVTVPQFEVGNWAGCEFEDASANSGEDIYSNVIVQAAGPDDAPIRAERSQTQQPGVTLEALATPAAVNPGFDTDVTTGVTIAFGTKTRDTLVYDTGPASLRLDDGAGNPPPTGTVLFLTLTGTFIAGVPYVARLRVRSSSTVSAARQMLRFLLGHVGGTFDYIMSYDQGFTANTWTDVLVAWTPKQTVSSSNQLWVGVNHNLARIWIDNIQILAARPTIVDRRGFKRTMVLPLQNAWTTGDAQTVGDAWLSSKKTAQLRGTIKATGRGVRRVIGGQGVHPAHLLRETNQLITLAHRIDPDTGRLGRDGEIAVVGYDDNARAATITIDNERDRLETVLQRYALISGQA